MQNRAPFLITVLLLSLLVAGCGSSSDEVAVFETNYGRIVIEFMPDVAPQHVDAYKAMIRDGFYDGTRFHRVLNGKIIQGGDPNSKDDDPLDDGLGQPGQPTIPAEFSTTVKHTKGIVSAARKGDSKDSATSQFFVCLGNEPAYDGQYTVFGRVVDGMSVVQLIAAAPLSTDPKFRDRPADPVTIQRAFISSRSSVGLPPPSNRNAPANRNGP